MKFSMVSGDVLKLECGALVVGIPAGGLTPTAEALDKASEGAVSRWIEAGDIHPCVGKVAVFRDFPGCKAERVVFVGLGKCKARDFQRVLKLGIDNAYLGKEVVLTTLEWLPDEVPEWIAEQSGFIACTALDRPKNYKTFDINWKKPKNIDLYVPDENKDIEKAYAEGVSVGVGVQMANSPPHRLRAEPPRRGGQESKSENLTVPAFFIKSAAFPACCGGCSCRR